MMWKEINVNSSKVLGSVYFVAQQRMLKKKNYNNVKNLMQRVQKFKLLLNVHISQVQY